MARLRTKREPVGVTSRAAGVTSTKPWIAGPARSSAISAAYSCAKDRPKRRSREAEHLHEENHPAGTLVYDSLSLCDGAAGADANDVAS